MEIPVSLLNDLLLVRLPVFDIGYLGLPLIFSEHIQQMAHFSLPHHHIGDHDILDLDC